MDVTEDTRLEELKAALSTVPLQSAPEEQKDITWLDSLDIKALTTLDLSQFTNSTISTLSANTAIAQAAAHGISTPTIHTIGGGGGGSGGYGYVYPSTTTGTGAIWNSSPTTVQITADDVVVKGRSLMSALDRIEERLGILDCDESLEQDWQELRALGDEYRKKKKHIEDKMKTFNTLKK